MKIRLSLLCPECRKQTAVSIDLNDDGIETVSECGHRQWGTLPLSLSIGRKVLCRAKKEFGEQEFPLAIVFSAMAADCELSRLHHKWEQLKAYEEGRDYIEEVYLEEMLRKLHGAKAKVDHVSQLLGSPSLDDFVASSVRFQDQIAKGFPSLSFPGLADSIVQILFWPRNAILHSGRTNYDRDKAKVCLNVARLLIDMLHAMDADRGSEFERKHGLP